MAYRNGTYIAFDGLGQTDPTKSDFRFYSTIRAWSAHRYINFKCINSHEKTCAVRDSSLLTTLKARIRTRLANSRNMVVIISSVTRKSGSILSYEIEKAVDQYELPLIIAYVDYRIIAAPDYLLDYWPTALNERIRDGTAKCIHIPFIKDAILDAIKQFDIWNKPPVSLSYYDESSQYAFGAITVLDHFKNTRK